jgi:tetratricopeptide (TPR) repeat protein
MLEGNPDRHVLQWATTLSAYQDRLAGHPAVSLDRLLRAFPSSDPANAAPTEDLAECYLDLGDVSRAETLAAQSVALSRARGDRVDLVWALRIQTQVAIRKQDYESAAACLEEGLSLARSTPDPYAEGCLLHVYGSLHAQLGEPTQARARLREALTIFQRLGARKDIEWSKQALIDLGR